MFNPLPYALARRQVRLAIPTTDGAALYEAVILPLWHEAEHAPGVPHDRPDVWRVLFRDMVNGSPSWRPGHIRANDCDALEADGIATPADIVTTNRPGTLARAEMLCVFARFGIKIRFDYTKDVGGSESRHATPLGFKAGTDGAASLMVAHDHVREASRTFKMRSIANIKPFGPIPSWEPMVGWMMPAATTVDPDADSDGVTAAKVDEMTDRRGRA